MTKAPLSPAELPLMYEFSGDVDEREERITFAQFGYNGTFHLWWEVGITK